MNWFNKTEEELDTLEQQIPLLAEKACRDVRVLPSGEIEIIKENR